jgi:hypothetical protein
MVKGLSIFRERLAAFERHFVLIGGTACVEWFAAQGLEFRSTKDLDLVLLIENVEPSFLSALRTFLREGGYETKERSNGSPVLYRFAKPADKRFPAMIELFSRSPEGLDLGDTQEIAPIPVGEKPHSLSAILLDDAYYALIQDHQQVSDGLRFVTATALIPLKANAWLDLTARRQSGEALDSRDIDKHRNDVFRLAATLPDDPASPLADSVLADLARFLEAFPPTDPVWPNIQNAMGSTLARDATPDSLLAAIRTFFRLP